MVPDPWCTNVAPNPVELQTYFRFVQQNVLEHTNGEAAFSGADYLKFLSFMASHGLSIASVSRIMRQLASERMGEDVKWRRVVLLDLLQFDVFRHYYRTLKPQFSTFFLNSTAHYQHCYWRNMDPAAFAVKPSEEENREYGDAIRYGYRQMDGLIGRFLRLAGDDATLVFCTGLSQNELCHGRPVAYNSWNTTPSR